MKRFFKIDYLLFHSSSLEEIAVIAGLVFKLKELLLSSLGDQHLTEDHLFCPEKFFFCYLTALFLRERHTQYMGIKPFAMTVDKVERKFTTEFFQKHFSGSIFISLWNIRCFHSFFPFQSFHNYITDG